MVAETRLAPFGLEVTGVALGSVKASDSRRWQDSIARHRVVVFRDGAADDDAFCAFLALLGAPMFTAGETPVAGFPILNIVSNIGRATPPRSVFHTDTSYVACPPAISALRAVVVPARGGATLFSDQVAAAAKLPPPLLDRLRGRTVAHGATGVDVAVAPVRHPLLCAHPSTGETSLYLSTPERCTGLSGVDAATSARAIDILYRRSIRPAGLLRHSWQPGDVVVWDNRLTMHRAEHGDVSGDRVLHRGLVAGEVPIMA